MYSARWQSQHAHKLDIALIFFVPFRECPLMILPVLFQCPKQWITAGACLAIEG